MERPWLRPWIDYSHSFHDLEMAMAAANEFGPWLRPHNDHRLTLVSVMVIITLKWPRPHNDQSCNYRLTLEQNGYHNLEIELN